LIEEEEEVDENVEAEDGGWGWTGIIFNLAKEDITKTKEIVKLDLLEVLTWLTHEKWKINKINEKNRNRR